MLKDYLILSNVRLAFGDDNSYAFTHYIPHIWLYISSLSLHIDLGIGKDKFESMETRSFFSFQFSITMQG